MPTKTEKGPACAFELPILNVKARKDNVEFLGPTDKLQNPYIKLKAPDDRTLRSQCYFPESQCSAPDSDDNFQIRVLSVQIPILGPKC